MKNEAIHGPSLEELAKSGTFGTVTFGLTEAEVEAQLGRADVTGGGSLGWRDNLWRYGDLEFGFLQPEYKLYSIGINFWGECRTPYLGDALRYDPWVLRVGLSFEQFVHECKLSSIEFLEKRVQMNEGCREIVTEGGMHAVFSAESYTSKDYYGLMKFVSTEHQKVQQNVN